MGFMRNKYFFFYIFFIVIEQSIVATSTIWLAFLTDSLLNNKNFILWLCLFIASMFLVYLPTSLYHFFESKAIYSSFIKYINNFTSFLSGKSIFRNSFEFKELKQPFFNNEGWLVINEIHTSIADTLRVILNVVLNIITLIIFVNYYFFIGYLLTIPIVFIILKLTDSKIELMTNIAQKSRTTMNQSLLTGFETFLIGNKLNKNIWKIKFSEKAEKSKKDTVKSVVITELITGFTTIASILPVIVILIMLILKNISNISVIAILVVTLPRQILILQTLSTFIWYTIHWKTLITKLKGIIKAQTEIDDERKYIGIINWSDIFIENMSKKINLDSIDKISAIVNENKTGRFTLRGKNGCGKSTLLLQLKNLLNEEAFLLPANPDNLLFNSTLDISLSTGQKIIKIIEEITKNIDFKVLLIDEWDANLDDDYLSLINDMIEILAEKICVIEVRHRNEI